MASIRGIVNGPRIDEGPWPACDGKPVLGIGKWWEAFLTTIQAARSGRSALLGSDVRD
ncbi:hypothetical protein J4G37_26790 [Microvirga sp. 3-52]|nr:hypothetical protein [Microvirga sp. 3-52]